MNCIATIKHDTTWAVGSFILPLEEVVHDQSWVEVIGLYEGISHCQSHGRVICEFAFRHVMRATSHVMANIAFWFP